MRKANPKILCLSFDDNIVEGLPTHRSKVVHHKYSHVLSSKKTSSYSLAIFVWPIGTVNKVALLKAAAEKINVENKILLLVGDTHTPLQSDDISIINSFSFDATFLYPEQIEPFRNYIHEATTDTRAKIDRTKSLVRFVKDISSTENIHTLLNSLRVQIESYKKIKAPILVYEQNSSELKMLFYQGKRFIDKVVPGAWPQQTRIRINDKSDSQYLANIFGRPFGKLIAIPLRLKRKIGTENLRVAAVLYFEHAFTDDVADDFLNYISELMPPLTIALDRLLIEQDLHEDSLLWERTFDGLREPIAIFDVNANILRANKEFTNNFENLSQEQLFGETIIHQGKFFETHSYPISMAEGEHPTNIINHYVDRTVSQRLRQQMIQNEKMAALGGLAGHIAHELNNPLTGIRSLTQILLHEQSLAERVRSDLKEVEVAAERCQTIIRNLIDFSSGDYRSQVLDISFNEIVQRTLPLLKTLISKFSLHLDLSSQSCMVRVEPRLMQQVVFNIIKNAAQAMGQQGELTIKTQVVEQHANKFVLLSVQDTGGGIDPKVESQIFDYFFTTKSHGQGTGLGLSISKSIVDRFSGELSLNNSPGVGSEFVIKLPLSTGM